MIGESIRRRLPARLREAPPAVRFGAVAGLALVTVVAVAGLRGGERVDFNSDVRPILNGKCIACHGGVKRSGGFGVLFREDALAIGESGRPGIVPRDADASELIRRITHPDPTERMPHDADPLSDEEIDILRRWIDQGAEWGEHWAYQPPVLPTVPEVKDESWPASDIDRFVLARLEAEGLEPSPRAPCETLLRRVSIDLVGLPPTVEEAEAFCADPSPAAYEKVVDRLLASPRYGENWASMWLDLARYADTKGYEKDQHRDIWPYRDWVIRALNEDMPFDRFTIEQLAGDLLPKATDDQLLATAFHRNTMTNDEDGTDDEEFRVAAVLDRVNTTMEVWQGTTIACVQCHSHPYDPIRHEEYYELFALFNNTLDGDRKNDGPRMPIYEKEGRRQVAEILSRIQALGVETAPAESALARRVEKVLHPLGWMPAADFDTSSAVMSTGDFVSPLENGGWVRYSNVDLDGVAVIGLGFSGKEGEVELRLDAPDGPLLGRAALAEGRVWRSPGGLSLEPTLLVPIQATPGRHDLVLVLLSDQVGGFRITSLSRYPAGMVEGEGSEELEHLVSDLLAVPPEAEVPVLRERPPDRRRITQLFDRGNWLVRTDTVQPGIPAALAGDVEADPVDRLEFARWLVSKENPLTARVIVNRIWARLFGTGIVPTLSDFGTQGDPPSHPALLDYLALRFRDEHDWSLKALVRDVVLSSTYQQSSRVTPESLEADPENRLLGRGPRVRLSAEQVRDQALAVAGLLSDRMYGPGVMPPQPPGLWSSPYNDRQWVTSPGEDRYRRAVYTYWKRTAPYPSLMAFDAPSREVCVSLRIQTNTPLQALVTLNDPVYVEAAQALARRMSAEGGSLEEQIRRGYRLALLRDPDAASLSELVDAYHDAAEAYRADRELLDSAVEPYRPYDKPPEDADGYVSAVAEGDESTEHPLFAEPPSDSLHTAALTTVASVIMNLDAFLTRE
ncbi:MAG TPA: DUF1553 domain-containing protein [Longimicrobiaceae bacterium]